MCVACMTLHLLVWLWLKLSLGWISLHSKLRSWTPLVVPTPCKTCLLLFLSSTSLLVFTFHKYQVGIQYLLAVIISWCLASVVGWTTDYFVLYCEVETFQLDCLLFPWKMKHVGFRKTLIYFGKIPYFSQSSFNMEAFCARKLSFFFIWTLELLSLKIHNIIYHGLWIYLRNDKLTFSNNFLGY